jgi:hypothetical protein
LYQPFKFYIFPYYLFESWENYEAFGDDKPPCFRWSGQHVAILMVEVMAAQTELLRWIIQGQQPHHQQ